MRKYILKTRIAITIGLFGIIAFSGCSTDFTDNGLVTKDQLSADFTITPVASSPNKFVVSANSENYILSQWNFDDGAGFVNGSTKFELFLPDAGTYTIKHNAVGIGGLVGATASKTVVVATSDPNSGNLIVGGKFATADDIAKWTITSSNGAPWTFTGGKATLKATGWAGNGIYQSINVVAGKNYKINMVASSTSGCVDTWFEVYCGYGTPVVGTDYSEGGKLYSISTWDGSGLTPFSGKISTIGTVAADNTGIFKATQTGTAYLVIRGGGSDMKDGISITNIEFRGM